MRRRLCALRTLVSSVVLLAARESAAVVALTAADVERIIGQAVAEAKVLQHPVTVAVVDHEGNPLGVFRMDRAPKTTTLRGFRTARQSEAVAATGEGLEGAPVPAAAAAISKAGTSAFFSTQGNAFTPRTASFIIQP